MEKRLTRVEEKVDIVRDDVTELKSDMKHLMPRIEEHITGDKKIINHITPLLEKLPTIVEMAESHQFEKMKRKEKLEIRQAKVQWFKDTSTKVGLFSLVLGMVVSVIKLVG